MIKVDLEKAYDCLSWKCIRGTLDQVDLPSSWIRNIMHCIEIVRMSIIWNGMSLTGLAQEGVSDREIR